MLANGDHAGAAENGGIGDAETGMIRAPVNAIVSARAAISEKVFAGIATIAVLGFLLLVAFDQLRRRLLRWHAETMVAI